MSNRWAVLTAVLLFAGVAAWIAVAKRPASAASAPPSTVDRESGDRLRALESRMARLGAEVGVLRTVAAASPEPEAHEVDATNAEDARVVPPEEPPEGMEEDEREAEERRADLLLARFDQRFTEEPVDLEWSAQREGEIRTTVASGQVASLVRSIACKWTMCRVEFAPSDLSIQDLWFAANLRKGGYGRKKPDGSTVLLTGREGYPFHQVNALD